MPVLGGFLHILAVAEFIHAIPRRIGRPEVQKNVAGNQLPQIAFLKVFRQRTASGGQRVDSLGDFRIFNQRRRVMQFHPRIDHKSPATTPVLVYN
jgi:hypothetical protein